MLIQQSLRLEQSENHTPGYYTEPMPSPLPLAASVSSSVHSSLSGAVQGVGSYPPTDNYFVSGRVQSEFGMNIYAQPGSSSISSTGNYVPVAGNVGSAPGLVGSHYGSGLEHSPYYSTLGDGYEMKPGMGEIWPGSYPQAPPSYYPYENTFGSQYHYERYCGMDINDGVRRKNATRESTNTLKAWLQEHKKNPYPTKGEKIMLAIITKMTLTQVSTWFANARRRLKKENKMTWVPKNRSNDGSNTKKTDDDDDIASQHSHGIEDDKTDLDQSNDSDDSDVQKVTSTNNNDSAVSSNVAELNEFKNDSTRMSEDVKPISEEKFASIPEPGKRAYNSFDKGNKVVWSPGNDEVGKQADDVTNNPVPSIRPTYRSVGDYASLPSLPQKPQTSMISPPVMTSDDNSRFPIDYKYSSNWQAPSYQGPISGNYQSSPHIQVGKSPEEMNTMCQHSPRIADAKTYHPSSIFPTNRPSDGGLPRSTSSMITSSYLQGFPNPTQDETSVSYRSPEQHQTTQIRGAHSSYYVQPELTSRQNADPSERIPPTYAASRESIPSKLGVPSIIQSASPTSPGAKQSFHQQTLHLNEPTSFYQLQKNTAPPNSEAVYSSPYYQQTAYNQLPSSIPPANGDYYTQKSDQLSGYSGSENSPFPMQAAVSPRK